MVRSHLSRYLGDIFLLYRFPSIFVIICIFVPFNYGTAMAGASVLAVSAPCPTVSPPVTQGASPVVVSGTIRSISGQSLQITPQIPGMPINAIYSSTTQVMGGMPIPASVLLKGATIWIQAIPNPGGTFTATLIILTQNNQASKTGCSPLPNKSNGLASKQATALPPANSGRQLGDPDCFASPLPSAATPSTGSKQALCQAIGTFVNLQGNAIMITDFHQKSHVIMLTSGTQIKKAIPAATSALRVGTGVTIMGLPDKGAITAFAIGITTP
jgi:hypothetical protein